MSASGELSELRNPVFLGPKLMQYWALFKKNNASYENKIKNESKYWQQEKKSQQTLESCRIKQTL